jgi:hypothetical protein
MGNKPTIEDISEMIDEMASDIYVFGNNPTQSLLFLENKEKLLDLIEEYANAKKESDA